jgi:hypothetical protein
MATTRKATVWPWVSAWIRLNVMSARHAPFSMSSMDINTTRMLRRSRTPAAPIMNMSADRSRK